MTLQQTLDALLAKRPKYVTDVATWQAKLDEAQADHGVAALKAMDSDSGDAMGPVYAKATQVLATQTMLGTAAQRLAKTDNDIRDLRQRIVEQERAEALAQYQTDVRAYDHPAYIAAHVTPRVLKLVHAMRREAEDYVTHTRELAARLPAMHELARKAGIPERNWPQVPPPVAAYMDVMDATRRALEAYVSDDTYELLAVKLVGVFMPPADRGYWAGPFGEALEKKLGL